MTDLLAQLAPELRDRWRRMLTDLEALAEGPAMKWEKSIRQGKSSGAPPKGAFRWTRKEDTPLATWYGSHLARIIAEGGPDDPRIQRLLWQAEADLKRTRYRSPVRKLEGDQEFARRVAERYEGMAAEEVAWVYENVRVAVIERARRQMGRKPEDGRPRDGTDWREWSEDRKMVELEQFRATGASQRQAAEEFGVSIPTIKRLERKMREAA